MSDTSSHPNRPLVCVPCYNEASRLPRGAFRSFAKVSPFDILFVDDGSTDDTAEVLNQLVAENPGVYSAMRLDRNSGKAEAVRRGLLEGVRRGAPWVGFLDADLSTALEEMARMLQEARAVDGAPVHWIMGSRIKYMGVRIDRRLVRHYLGRVFATFASMVLRLPVYDTQCGAKWFRVTPLLTESLQRKFHSRWIFDIELLSRMLTGYLNHSPIVPENIREFPLRSWMDVRGSRLKFSDFLKVPLELWWIERNLTTLRRRGLRLPSNPQLELSRSSLGTS